MALADTARLVASLELQDKFSRTADKFDSRIGRMDQHLKTFGRNVAIAGVAGIGFLAANVTKGVQSLIELENVTAATNAVIQSTGGAAGVSAEKVRELAEAYESVNATIDDKVIQAAENLLLTFPEVTEKAFEPALEAALNLNQALGGGEEGLQGTVLQIGKALQDPIRGLTALRRSGVSFTKAQQDQIKALVEANDLYGAQTIILGELSRQFGGQFAAAGDTAAGNFARFQDAVEDTQMALATAFLPVLEKVSDKLTALLADPATRSAISELGTNLADAFDSIVDIAGNLPWGAIGDAFKLMGTGSKALLDAFTQLPPWVQTAVLTGWGLNKLTGGGLTTIVSTLASGLIKGVLGINAGVVNLTAGTVRGGGAGGGGTGGGGVVAGLGRAFIFTAVATILGELAAQGITRPLNPTQFDFNQAAGASGRFSRPEDAQRFAQTLAAELAIPLEDVKTGIVEGVAGGMTFDQAVADLRRGQDEGTRVTRDEALKAYNQRIRDREQTRQALDNLRAVGDAQKREAAQHAAAAQGALLRIAEKDFSPEVNVSVTSNVTISEIQRKITSQQIAIGRGFQEFE